MSFIKTCRAIPPNLDHNSHLLQHNLKLVEEGVALYILAPHLEQEAQTGMSRVRVNAMFTDDLVVCFEKGSEGESPDLGFSLGANDDLIEKADIF